jgi:polar amino acid transport system substrate-binding protein
MDYKDENGKWIGFDAELAEMFAEKLGVTCEFVEIDWNNKVAEINAYEIDLIWNGMTASDELGQSIDFSVSYAKNAQVAVVLKSSSIASKAEIKTATVAVENGSAGKTVAEEEEIASINAVTNQKQALL